MRTFRVLTLALCLALIPAAAAAADCEFVLGFKAHRDFLGHDVVGECLENERFHIDGAQQRTTNGTLYWHREDNYVRFVRNAEPTPTPAVSPTGLFSLGDFVNGPWLEQEHPQLAAAIKNLSWARDSIDDRESEVIQRLLYIAARSATVASSVASLGWMQDGITEDEAKAIQEIYYIAYADAEGALWIVGMPFLAAIEPPDVSALDSLGSLANFRPEAFAGVMSHAALRDGITDEEAPIVATLNGVAKTNPGLIGVLLNPSRVLLERRIITLPLSGGVILDIIRTAPGAARSMSLLEHSVREAEAFMGVPFPTKHVILLYENAVTASFAGTNFGTHIASLPKYDSDDDSHEAAYAGNHTAHEVAHYYWSGNKDWIDEGAANFMAAIIENARTGRPLGVDDFPCAYADSIAELESLSVVRGDSAFNCNYALGERLFLDLHHTLGYERSRQGFRALYLASESEDDAELGIQHVREAFRSNDAAVSAVIARWYNGTRAYDLSRLDRRPVNSRLPSINGRINKAYITTRENGPAVSTFSAQHVTDWVYLTLKYSYNVSGAKREVPVEIVEYYEDGFEIRRQSDKITAESRYIGGTQWREVGFRPSRKWAPGRYWVYVYAGGRKVAEAQYRVTP